MSRLPIFLCALTFVITGSAFAVTKQVNVKAANIKDISREMSIRPYEYRKGFCEIVSTIFIHLHDEKEPLEEVEEDEGSSASASYCKVEKADVAHYPPPKKQKMLLQALNDIKEGHVTQERVVENNYYRVMCSRPTLRLEYSTETKRVIDWQIGETVVPCP